MRWLARLSLALLLVSGAFSLTTSTPARAVECGYNVGGENDALKYDPSGPGQPVIRGAEADIRVRTPELCGLLPSSFSTAWSMLAQDGCQSNSAHCGYAQVGYWFRGGLPKHWVWQWNIDGSFANAHTGTWGTPGEGSVHNMKTSRYPNGGKIHMLVNESENPPCNAEDPPVCPVTNFDPVGTWSGLNAVWAGETGFPGDNVVGLETATADFTAVHFKDGDDVWLWNGWTEVIITQCWYKMNTYILLDSFEIWTKRDC